MTDSTTPTPRTRVRWGWIIGCIVLGLAGIGAGVVDFEARMATEWARFDPADAEAVRRRSARLTDEMVGQVVNEATGYATRSRPSPE